LISIKVHPGIETMVGEERGHACRFGGQGIRAEFRNRQPSRPVVLPVVDVRPEVPFQVLIEAFGLSVSLRVIGGRQLRFDG
jgi:hypothetical protein